MFAISTAPVKQSVGDTITVLSGRLGSATLLEDRRAAILGLRSFAKDYPATVASDALRSLIGSLAKDGEDVDTVKVVLETLLMLFSPNEDSPEASDEIALWLADEFTQRQENITLLLDFLDTTDFYSRLYTLQLLGAIHSARPQRTDECIFTAPLGISRLVAILDDQRDAVRNEGITLLTALTPSSVELQKLVAFESAFEKILAIVEADGALIEGGRAVEDCFILMANLLRRNPSNQSLFRESGCVSRLTDLLAWLLRAHGQEGDIASWAQAQRNRNLYAFLAVIRLFLFSRSVGTPQNQTAFWKHGLSNHVLQLAFSPDAKIQIRAEALATSGDLIRDNKNLQEGFAQLRVTSPLQNRDAPSSAANGQQDKVYVIDGLLDITLGSFDLNMFDLRYAACECLKAYFSNHGEVRLHFLQRAIDGFQSQREDSANVLSVLLTPVAELPVADPYRLWFAAVITLHLLYDNPTAKSRVLAVTEGDASDGEEVVSSVHTVSARLLTGIRQDEDPRILVGYLMLLLGWLFEDLDAVNDFLAEGSNVQSLLQAVTQVAVPGGELVQGLCAMLLGIVYEFSTKDSPLPRATLHAMLMKRMERDRYLDRLLKLRSHPFLRDYEVIPQKVDLSQPGTLPDVYFDALFVDFFKDNYSRAARALDRDPEMEISVIADGVQKGISRELVDTLRAQVDEKDHALQNAASTIATLERQLGQEQADSRRFRDSNGVEMAKLKSAHENQLKSHEVELRKVQSQHAIKVAEHEKEVSRIKAQLTSKENEYQKQLSQVKKSVQADAERIQRRTEAEAADLRATISRLEVDLMKANKSKAQELHTLREESAAERKKQASRADKAESLVQDLESQLEKAQVKADELRDKVKEYESSLEDAAKSRQTTQSELDDLLIVFGDLEEKAGKYKARLRELGEAVSEGEDEDDQDETSSDEDDVD